MNLQKYGYFPLRFQKRAEKATGQGEIEEANFQMAK
jgi:hypothetical protein